MISTDTICSAFFEIHLFSFIRKCSNTGNQIELKSGVAMLSCSDVLTEPKKCECSQEQNIQSPTVISYYNLNELNTVAVNDKYPIDLCNT